MIQYPIHTNEEIMKRFLIMILCLQGVSTSLELKSNDLDTLTDQMIQKGIEPDVKKPSVFMLALRKVASPFASVILFFQNIRQRMRNRFARQRSNTEAHDQQQ